MKAYMRSAMTVFRFILFFAIPAFAQKGTDISLVYQWKSERVEPGYFYHYVFSDMKGKSSIPVYYYVSGKEEFEWLQNAYLDSYQKAIHHTVNRLDRERLYYKSISIVNLLPASEKSYRNYEQEFDYAAGKMRYVGVEIQKGRDRPITLEKNLEQNLYLSASGGQEFFAFFPHLKDDVKPFTLRYSDTLGRSYDMDCRFDKEEKVGDILCRKYFIEGQGLLAKTMAVNGAVWLAKDSPARYLVKHTMNMRVNWEMPNAMLTLIERKKMSPEEWKSFQAALVEEQKMVF